MGRKVRMIGLSPIFSRVGLECPILSIGVVGRNPDETMTAWGWDALVVGLLTCFFDLDDRVGT